MPEAQLQAQAGPGPGGVVSRAGKPLALTATHWQLAVAGCLCFVDIISAYKAIGNFDESKAEKFSALFHIRLV